MSCQHIGIGIFIVNNYGIFTEESEVGTVTYNSAVAVSHTGDTLETTLATVTIPGGLLLANSVIEIQALWKIAGGLDEGVLRLYFGDTRYLDYGYPVATALTNTTIYCNNSITAQKGMPAGAGGIAELGSPPLTSAVNTANPVDVTFKGRVLNAGDSVTLEGCRIKLNGV